MVAERPMSARSLSRSISALRRKPRDAQCFVLRLHKLSGLLLVDRVVITHPGRGDVVGDVTVQGEVLLHHTDPIRFARTLGSDKSRDAKIRVDELTVGRRARSKLAKLHIDLAAVREEWERQGGQGTVLRREEVMECMRGSPVTITYEIWVDNDVNAAETVPQTPHSSVSTPRHSPGPSELPAPAPHNGAAEEGSNKSDVPDDDVEPGYELVTTNINAASLGARISNHAVPPTVLELVPLPSGEPSPLLGTPVGQGAQLFRFNGEDATLWDMPVLRSKLADAQGQELRLVWRVRLSGGQAQNGAMVNEAPAENSSPHEEAGRDANGHPPKGDQHVAPDDLEGLVEPAGASDGDEEANERASKQTTPPPRADNADGDEEAQEAAQAEEKGEGREEKEGGAEGGEGEGRKGEGEVEVLCEVKEPEREAAQQSPDAQQPPDAHEVALVTWAGEGDIPGAALAVPRFFWSSDEAFVLYLVSRRVGPHEAVHEVLKRFNDFAGLHDGLVADLGSDVIPELPDRSSLAALMHKHSAAYSASFVEERRAALEGWLQAVRAVPEAWRSPHTHHFFRTDHASRPRVVRDFESREMLEVVCCEVNSAPVPDKEEDQPQPAEEQPDEEQALEVVMVTDLDTGRVFPLSQADKMAKGYTCFPAAAC